MVRREVNGYISDPATLYPIPDIRRNNSFGFGAQGRKSPSRLLKCDTGIPLPEFVLPILSEKFSVDLLFH